MNIITIKIIEDVGLAIQYGPKLELVSHTSHSCLFLSFCNNVEIDKKRLKIRHLIFVIEQGDYNLILDQLFLNLVKFSLEYKPDGIFGTIIYLYTQQSAVFQTFIL